MRLPVAVLATTLSLSAAAAKHPFGFDDLIAARRIGELAVSPDGATVAYAVTTHEPVENRRSTALYLQPIAGGPPRQLTGGKGADTAPAFAPDGKRIAFVSNREGSPQLWLLDLAGGDPRKISDLPGGADGALFTRDGRSIITASEVYPDCSTVACNRERFERAEKKNGSSGRVIERLLYRHWDTWKDGRRTHLFLVDVDAGGARDLTPGDFDAPPFALQSSREYDLSPDGKSFVFASNHDPVEAISTNSDLWEVPLAGGAARHLTAENRAYDGTPRYSPDGKFIAYRAQRQPGVEADRFELMLLDRASGATRSLTAGFDDWVEEIAWARSGRSLYFTSVVKGHAPLFSVTLDGQVSTLLGGVTASDPTPLPDGGLLFGRASLTRPTELWRLPPGAASSTPSVITHENDKLFASVEMGEVRERWVDLGGGERMQAWVVLPPGATTGKRYPALLWVHGGPENAWEDSWSYRWNPEVLASAGYVVYLPNPRGSLGYGQAFVNGVARDWGGKPFDDLMRAADDLEKLPIVDAKRIGSAGASYGGFMENWFQGHTDRFKALFCHDGVADQRSMYATEELWFNEHEMGGLPWTSPLYAKWSPAESAARFKTPELIVHGERDYRVPVEQALLMFSLLERRGVPAKMLLFPDENHWVLKPANARLWYATMIDWFHRWLGGAAADPKALKSASSVTR